MKASEQGRDVYTAGTDSVDSVGSGVWAEL